VVSVYESGVRSDKSVGIGRLASGVADVGPRRLRRSAELVGRAPAARPQVHNGGVIGRSIGAVMRLVFPVILLLTIGAAAFLYSSASTPWLGNIDVAGKPLSLGLSLSLLTFFAVHLTNRRFGAGYATAQVLVAWTIALASVPLLQPDLALLHEGALPDIRIAAGFGGALFIAQLVSIFVFDRMRGPAWWQAPLFASLVGGIFLCTLAYPLAYAGTGAAWQGPMVDFMGVMVVAAIAMVVPYWLLRSIVPPLSGFGGY
jgi:uncharacterized PurR-regulated membrane protein YhhQ (DUF165 family)